MMAGKTSGELNVMREGGAKLAAILKKLLLLAVPGTTLLALDAVAEKLITETGGEASFKTVEGYKWATCLCVNEAVVHGIPTNYPLQKGDILTIDIGLLYQGLHTDTAWTIEVGSGDDFISVNSLSDKQVFLNAGKKALVAAISEAKDGNRVGNISKAIQSAVEAAGYSIVRSLVGHGVGQKLHEAPQVPGFLRGAIEETAPLAAGMTLAIEVIYAQGAGAVVYNNDDGWTIATRDRSLSAVFEHTIAIAGDKAEILTGFS